MEEPVLHVIVIGFHHKKGCQVEFSYPPLIEGNSYESHEIPEEWKHIPSLALPDGAHNYQKDTVYFVLPGRKKSLHTVYGVSCYRQMDAKDLINKTADVTRSTVQKSVCVLSKLPLFGLIKAKLELITHAYFDERDFSQVTLLEQTYKNLNISLTQSLLQGTQVFLGLPVRDLVILYRHKIIVLFKLLLLERRVLFFGSPVEKLSQTLLSLVSLFPGMLENGLLQSCNQLNKKLSPTMGITNVSSDQDESEEFLEIRYHATTPESPLSEVMGHMHNSALHLGAGGDTDYTSLHINEGDMSPCVPQTTEAPESPTIPRDALDVGTEHLSLSSPAVEKNHSSKVQGDKSPTAPESVYRQYSRSSSNSSSDGAKLSVHAFSKSSKHSEKKDAKCGAMEDVTYHEDDSPLTHVEAITHIESIQAEASSNDNNLLSDSARNNSKGGKRSGAGNLTLHNTTERLDDGELIEDLDSPESISKIDREDCFSWEQDSLQLTFDHVLQQEECPKVEAIPNLMTASRDSATASESGKESASSDTNSASVSSLDRIGQTAVEKKIKSSEISPNEKHRKSKAIRDKLSAAFHKSGNGNRQSTKGKKGDLEVIVPKKKQAGEVVLKQDGFGYPLAIFTKGCVCHPYLSLQYHDILTDVNVRSFLVGATNILFKQRRQLIDVVVEVGDGKVDLRDKELQRQLSLTTADLRFAEYLVKVTAEKPGDFYDGTEWEGSDEWIRAQFKHYLNCLLATVLTENQKLLEDFGSGFVSAWKTTNNYRHWQAGEYAGLKEMPTGHPFQGHLSMTDVRVRFNHTLQSSEQGRRINAAVMQTGKYVMQTGKVVGGAISSAKSAVSGWFSSWRTTEKILPDEVSAQPEPVEENGNVQSEGNCEKPQTNEEKS
ncbi:late secretory pathway protein avl9 homolog [Plakobranchus ocellatus]|uniref:Late secretory pathway protein avl9 homolog n=1 Tax=Plakobranchus ocellatus TaxID=259542 RepID=A0AAV4DWL6_9GAST|nr:late secretory pathway protein avl9 homolog [Plakobranchus ocellatus]